MADAAPLILVVDDEESYRDALTVALEREGFRVEVAADGQEAIDQFDATSPSLVLLDVMLPRISGVDVCRDLRSRSRVPIIMVTARSNEIDAVVGLEVGADDYVSKPFRLRELIARVRAALRRSVDEEPAGITNHEVLEIGDVRLDAGRHEVFVRGDPVPLPLKEFELLELLLANAGTGPDPRRPHRPDLGAELLRRHQDARRARQAPAGQGRGGPLEPDARRHHPGRRLPLREAHPRRHWLAGGYCVHDRAPVGEGRDVPARHLGVVVGAAQREDGVEPRLGVEAGSLGVVESAALDLERVDAPGAQPGRVVAVDGDEVALGLVVLADEPRDPFAQQVGHRRGAGAGVRAGTARPQHGAHVVHEPGDLELLVVRRDAGEERRALQAVREQVDDPRRRWRRRRTRARRAASRRP